MNIKDKIARLKARQREAKRKRDEKLAEKLNAEVRRAEQKADELEKKRKAAERLKELNERAKREKQRIAEAKGKKGVKKPSSKTLKNIEKETRGLRKFLGL